MENLSRVTRPSSSVESGKFSFARVLPCRFQKQHPGAEIWKLVFNIGHMQGKDNNRQLETIKSKCRLMLVLSVK